MTKEKILECLAEEIQTHNDLSNDNYLWETAEYHTGYEQGLKFAYQLIEKLNEEEEREIVIKNLTPHDITVYEHNSPKCVVKAEPSPARCVKSQTKVKTLEGIPIYQLNFGEVFNLPPEKEGTYYIVSRVVAEACPERKDLLITGSLIRDQNDKVVGCDGLMIV